jgi:hypothetical protein
MPRCWPLVAGHGDELALGADDEQQVVAVRDGAGSIPCTILADVAAGFGQDGGYS